jgi:hypothetical protein
MSNIYIVFSSTGQLVNHGNIKDELQQTKLTGTQVSSTPFDKQKDNITEYNKSHLLSKERHITVLIVSIASEGLIYHNEGIN